MRTEGYIMVASNRKIIVAVFLLMAFATMFLCAEAGALEVTNGSVVHTQNGTVIAFDPVPNTGYAYSGGLSWTIRGINNPNNVYSGTESTFTAPVEDTYNLTEASANFTLTKHIVSYSSYGEGSVSGSVSSGSSVDYGTVVTFKATPNTGVTFEDWSINGSRGTLGVDLKMTITGNTDIVGYFYDTRNKITVPSVTGGTVTASVASADPGEAVRVSATPDAGYKFVRWEFNTPPANQVDMSASEIVFIMPGNPITVTPVYSGAPVATAAPSTSEPDDEQSAFTIMAGEGGMIIEGAPGNFASDDNFVVSAQPNEGFLFDSWVVTGDGTVADTAAASTTFTMGGDDSSLTANFVADPNYVPPLSEFLITIEGSTGGAVTTDMSSATEGTIITVNATPQDGFSFHSWGSGSGVTFDDPESDTTFFVMPNRDVSVKAEFEKQQFLGGPVVWAIIGGAVVVLIAIIITAVLLGKRNAAKQMAMYNTTQFGMPPQYGNMPGGMQNPYGGYNGYGYPPGNGRPMGAPQGQRRGQNQPTGAFGPITDNMVNDYRQNGDRYQQDPNFNPNNQNYYQNEQYGDYEQEEYENGYNDQYNDEYNDGYQEEYDEEYSEEFDQEYQEGEYDGQIEYSQEYPEFSDDEIELEDEFYDPTRGNTQQDDFYDD